jgi:hypothetical protein
VPPLTKSNSGKTESKEEQAEELLETFFPLLPESIKAENGQQLRKPLDMPPLTVEEIEQRVIAAGPWKAPGDDGLPAIV